MHCTRDMYARRGAGVFFEGLVPRSARCVGAVFILSQFNTMFHGLFDKYDILGGEQIPAENR